MNRPGDPGHRQMARADLAAAYAELLEVDEVLAVVLGFRYWLTRARRR